MLLRHAPRARLGRATAAVQRSTTAPTSATPIPATALPAAALTSTAAPSSAATALDVQCMLQAGGLSDICNAAGMEVAVVADLVMGPYQFWPQACRPVVVGLWLQPTSAAILVSLRKLSSRSQWRHTLEPGQCLVLGPTARLEWALAVPPDLKGGVRRFRVLAATTIGMDAAAIQPSVYALPTRPKAAKDHARDPVELL
jgi:hypothetical protein